MQVYPGFGWSKSSADSPLSQQFAVKNQAALKKNA